MTDWDIQPRSHVCTACQQPFADKQTYHTLLSLSGGGYARRDLCAGCYTGVTRDGVISYWQGEYKLPPLRQRRKRSAPTTDNGQQSLF